jgi:SSS family solute:Na+ symporter
MVYGTIQAYRVPIPGQANSHFGGSTAPVLGHIVYIAVVAFIINLLIAVAFSIVFRAFRLPAGTDETQPGHYTADPETGPPAPAPDATGAPTTGSG